MCYSVAHKVTNWALYQIHSIQIHCNKLVPRAFPRFQLKREKPWGRKYIKEIRKDVDGINIHYKTDGLKTIFLNLFAYILLSSNLINEL